MDPDSPSDLNTLRDFDTILCFNVLEYLDDPAYTLRALHGTLKPGGLLVTLVPHNPSVYGSIDCKMGHKPRFLASGMAALLEASGYQVDKVLKFNRSGGPTW